MDSHIIGQGHFSEDSSSTDGSSSLAVRQFADVAFGWTPVHKPLNPFRVETVTVEERYCLNCFGVRRFDVLRGVQVEAAFCRCCGAEADHA
jgi:hypothetical protein